MAPRNIIVITTPLPRNRCVRDWRSLIYGTSVSYIRHQSTLYAAPLPVIGVGAGPLGNGGLKRCCRTSDAPLYTAVLSDRRGVALQYLSDVAVPPSGGNTSERHRRIFNVLCINHLPTFLPRAFNMHRRLEAASCDGVVGPTTTKNGTDKSFSTVSTARGHNNTACIGRSVDRSSKGHYTGCFFLAPMISGCGPVLIDQAGHLSTVFTPLFLRAPIVIPLAHTRLARSWSRCINAAAFCLCTQQNMAL